MLSGALQYFALSGALLCGGRFPDMYCKGQSLKHPATPILSSGALLCVVVRALLHGVRAASFVLPGTLIDGVRGTILCVCQSP